ncbi:hypothetical protein JTB14_002727 [Gonioctena quinquepunctata]|nr:hypothetical protein JTB14_002727 [Gonioctena quinquepunctata]
MAVLSIQQRAKKQLNVVVEKVKHIITPSQKHVLPVRSTFLLGHNLLFVSLEPIQVADNFTGECSYRDLGSDVQE